jgi:NAD(P)-dependent dehydrogenase (short-subunit alcohol dehydrogenase family)
MLNIFPNDAEGVKMDINNNILNFSQQMNVAVIGGSGGIGNSLLRLLAIQNDVQKVYCFSRSTVQTFNPKIECHTIDITDEKSVIDTAFKVKDNNLDAIIIVTGILHSDLVSPEKNLKDISLEQMQKIFEVNTFGPALIAKHFLPLIPKNRKSVFAALSARVGSIEDNHLGGWYSYRASKAALNMIIKTTSIEVARRYKKACVVGLHPGTVDTELSKPFQGNVKEGKLFTPEYSASCLLKVMNTIDEKDTGKLFAWDGQKIPY